MALAATGASAGCSSPVTPSRQASGSTTTQIPPGGQTTTSTTSTTAVASSLPIMGQYTDGPTYQPHYVLDLTATTSSTLAGTISFVYQDGRTSTVLTFSGTASSGSAQLTTAPGARLVDVTYTTQSIDLESCTKYLEYATTPSSCTFTYSAASSTTTTG